jgi:hypothetical protein
MPRDEEGGMSPVEVQCADCHEEFPVSVSHVDVRPPQACPRCGREEMLIAALAGEDTSWYWGLDDADEAPVKK